MRRREFLLATAALPMAAQSKLKPKERVDRALKGADVDRPPFTFWHHFGLKDPFSHAKRTLDFHQSYRTDIVKVMSDFPYPGNSLENLKVLDNPFPAQIQALQLIKEGLGGRVYFIETIFNPFNVAEKLTTKQHVRQLMKEKPQALLDALDVITQSEIHHIQRALKLGAAGVLFSVANANANELSREEYAKFSRPFDKRIDDAVANTRLTFLHLHVDPGYLDLFKDFRSPVVNYSHKVSRIPIADMRKHTANVIAGGVDETTYRSASEDDLRSQIEAARGAAGPKWILTPGCSVPDESTAAELARLPRVVGA